MTKRFWIVGLGAAALVAVAGSSLSAQQSQQPPPTMQLGGVAQMPAVDRYVVGAAKPPIVAGAPVIDISLDEAIQIALEKNLDLQVQKMNPAIQDYALVVANANYRPTMTGNFGQTHTQTPSTSTLDGVTSSTNTTSQGQTYQAALSQNLKFQGASASATFTSGRTATNSIFSTKNPQLNAGLKFAYSQPLLQGRTIDNARTRIKTQEITRQITDINLLATIENTKASVRAAYWALRQAIEAIEIAQRTKTLSQQLLDNVKIQVQIGTSAGIETAQPEVAVAQNDQLLLSAKIAWQTAELALKRLLVSGKDDDLYRRTINPTEQALLGGEPTVNIDGAVQAALANRTDIQTALKGIESSTLSLAVSKNITMPSLNLNAGYNLSGIGGPTLKSGIVTTPGGYGDAITSLTDAPSWNMSLNFTYPIGMTSAKAQLSSAQLTLEQSRAQLKVTELSVATDVTSAGLNVQNSYQSYLAAKKASEAQQAATEAEQTKFNVGVSNTYNVVQQQNALTSARLSELKALITYINALADFEKKQRIGGGTSAPTTSGGS
jgi:outer membrane protein